MAHHFENTRIIPREVQEVLFCELSDGSGNPLDPALFGVKYKKCDVLVASTFGLCGGLIRQREQVGKNRSKSF